MTIPTQPERRRDGDATRQRLLRAALELFTAQGFHATTTPALAQKAGVAEGTIYRHFDSKEQLLNEAYRGAFRWATGVLRDLEAQERAQPARERLLRFGRRLLEAADRDPAAIRMLLHGHLEPALDDRSRDVAREFREALQQVIASGKADGAVRAGPADLWAALWLRVVGLAAERVAAREWNPEHAQAQLTLDAAWDALAVRAEG